MNDLVDHVLDQLQHMITKDKIIQKKIEIEQRIIGKESLIFESIYALVFNSIEAVERRSEKIICITIKDGRNAFILLKDTGYGVLQDIEPFISPPLFLRLKGP